MGLFGKTQEKPPKEPVNEWSLKIRKEMRVVDRQKSDIQREKRKSEMVCERCCQEGPEGYLCSSGQGVAGSLQKSTEVMKAMQRLVKIPEIQATMRQLSKEMMKAGIIEEMLEDTFESMDDQEEMEEEAEMEIDRILFEITEGALGKAPSKVTDALPEAEPSGVMAASEDEKEEEALEAMQSQLATLRS
uniref:Charged multivesicular body protein 3 n=1 Tax=Cercocebus atys TaxID=9531 RepID=A0A2K5L3R8_CERAT